MFKFNTFCFLTSLDKGLMNMRNDTSSSDSGLDYIVKLSSPTVNCKWRGVILLTFKSLDLFLVSSKTSAVKYSKIAALYTAAVAPTLVLPLT